MTSRRPWAIADNRRSRERRLAKSQQPRALASFRAG